MPEQPSEPAARRARPLAELALEPLRGRVSELARRWAVALILERPTETMGSVALEDLGREAPELLDGLLGALSSDGELEALLGGGRAGSSPAQRIAAMSGAAGAGELVAAVEALRGVLSDALVDEFGLAAPDPVRARQLTDLADRLAHICAVILPIALAGIETLAAAAPESPAAAARPAAPVIVASGRHGRGGALIIDERAAEPAPAGPEELYAPPGAVSEPSPGGEIEIRDERGDEGPAAWIRSIGRQLERFEEDRRPFAVVLIECRDDAAGQADLLWDAVEERLREEVRAAGSGTMTRERAGRYWLVVAGTDRLGAAGLAAQLTRALESIVRGQRPGMSVAVGTAVCPEDGRKASALAAHADVGLYAARAERQASEGRMGV